MSNRLKNKIVFKQGFCQVLKDLKSYSDEIFLARQ